MMLGLLLARAGIEVEVLEKHEDFLRDFRGDTIHPSTMEILGELGLLDRFLALPHDRVERAGVRFPDRMIWLPDFSRLKVRCPFIAMTPQWNFLNFLAETAGRYPGFSLRMKTEATGLIEEGGDVRGLTAEGPEGPVEIRARLVVAADGRHSVLRDAAGLPLKDLGAPIDVLWLRIPRNDAQPEDVLASIVPGRLVVLIDRGNYWQAAFVIAKGAFNRIRDRGLDAFRADLRAAAPFLGDSVAAIHGWDQVKLLTVRVDRLEEWHRPGFLAIGDAAHAMSPVGGVGINLAIQDAVAAANALWKPLAAGRPTPEQLARVAGRRRWPVSIIQRAQVIAHTQLLAPVLLSRDEVHSPWLLRQLSRFGWFRRFAAWAIGIGPRAEHVESPEASVMI